MTLPATPTPNELFTLKVQAATAFLAAAYCDLRTRSDADQDEMIQNAVNHAELLVAVALKRETEGPEEDGPL